MTTRRDFIKKTVAGTAALSLGSIIPGFGSNSYQEILGANEKIRIGVIGVNSRGNALAQGFAKMKGCEVTYLCDVDSRALERCQADIHKISGRTPKGEKDIRKMLESDDFEAVVIATPDHWHAKAAIMAMQAGKHVYLEKPIRITNLCKINLSGASDLKVSDLICDRIDTHSSGSSDMNLKGKANDGKYSCSGSSDIKAYDFVIKRLKCSASGSSDIFTTVTEKLEANASGSSDIKYKGNPEVKKHSSGSSDIDHIK